MNALARGRGVRGGLARKLIIVAAVLAVVVLFFALDLQRFLTLDYLKQSRAGFQQLYAENPFSVIAVYFLVYVVVVAVNLPGAAVMTLAGGALFGFWVGLVVVSFASSIGASLACLVARHLFRDVVQRKFGDRLARVQAGVEREGAFYLFTMRLIPVIPFFAINLVMGLTRMPILTFYWVSQLGMLAGTAVYVNAGRELGRIDSLSGILSPGLILSFALIGIFPLAAKKALNLWRGKKGLRRLDGPGQ